LGEEEKIKNRGEQGPTLVSGCSLEYYIKEVANFINEKIYVKPNVLMFGLMRRKICIFSSRKNNNS